jgi:transcriptional regulator with PAS, ATPase and Fis domain
MHDEDLLRTAHLPSELVADAVRSPVSVSSDRGGGDGRPAIPTLEEIELAHIRRVLDICRGNRTLAAQHLGITRQTLGRKIGAGDEA